MRDEINNDFVGRETREISYGLSFFFTAKCLTERQFGSPQADCADEFGCRHLRKLP